MRGLFGDIHHAIRVLLKSPTQTLIALAALGLGIGVNTAGFSSMYSMVMHPFPFRDLDRIVRLWDTDQKSGAAANGIAAGDYLDFRGNTRSFEAMAALTGYQANLTGVADPEHLEAFAVSSSFFPLLGMQPELGRSFTTAEDQPGRDRVVVISHGLWERRFALSRDVIGRAVLLDGRPFTVLGVMPQSFDFPLGADLWKPLPLSSSDRKTRDLMVLGKLREGIAPGAAMEEMKAIASRLEERFPETNAGHTVRLRLLRESANEVTDTFVVLLLAAAGFVLLLACANVANLQLARGLARERESALRVAIGASRARIARLFLVENLVLAFSGAIIGVLLASWSMELQRSVIPQQVYKWVAGLRDMRLNWQALAFTTAIAVVTGVLCGIAPAVQAARASRFAAALKEGGRGTVGSGHGALRKMLVVFEVALAVVLVVAAGLMVQTFRKIATADLGFDTRRLLTMRIALPSTRYRDAESIRRYYSDALARVNSVDGIVAAGASSADAQVNNFSIAGHAPAKAGEFPPPVRYVSPSFVQTLGLKILEGRDFVPKDAELRPTRSIVISEAVARRYWALGEKAVGATVHLSDHPPLQVIGVVADTRDWFSMSPLPVVYVLDSQAPQASRKVFVRTKGDPILQAAAIRAQVQSVDPSQPIFDLKTQEQELAEEQSGVRNAAGMMMTYAAIALVLAISGIYGVVAWSAARRTRDIGVRMALGAQSGDVLRMVVGESLRLAAIGLAIGLAAAYGLMRAASSALYGVVPLEPWIFAAVVAALALAALAAGYIPARRATQADPLVALRYE